MLQNMVRLRHDLKNTLQKESLDYVHMVGEFKKSRLQEPNQQSQL